MKIDIHAHTKKCKSGDADTRDISPERFCEIVESTDLKIIAITNHNYFDNFQYHKIRELLSKDISIWPGIELDVTDGGNRFHLLVIVSDKKRLEFLKSVRNITYNSSPDLFITSIEKVLNTFDNLSPIYVVHYKKNPSITDSALLKLESLTENPQQILKEVSNSISAGIFISHGHSSIYGSDVQNWDEYKKISNSLPELRLPVGSFEQFCLLLKKDKSTINTLLDEKNSEEIILHPFSDDTSIKLKIYNDINVFFGPKGSGKTFILKSIEKYYTDLGVDAKIYTSASDRLEEIFDIKNKNSTIQVDSQNIQRCSDEIEKIKNAKEIFIPSISKYIDHFRQTCSNKNAKKILLKDIHQMPIEMHCCPAKG